MNHVLNVFNVDFKMFTRNKQALFFLLFLPILVLLLFRLVMPKDYFTFVAPGLLGFAVMQIGVFSLATTLLPLRDKGILRRLQVTPIRRPVYVAAQLLERVLFTLAELVVMFILIDVAFGIPFKGSYLALLVTVILGTMMFTAFGFAVAGFARNAESCVAISNFFTTPMTFLGGVFFATSGGNRWVEYVSKVLPLTYLTSPVRGIAEATMNGGDVATNWGWMAGWSIVFFVIAMRKFRWE